MTKINRLLLILNIILFSEYITAQSPSCGVTTQGNIAAYWGDTNTNKYINTPQSSVLSPFYSSTNISNVNWGSATAGTNLNGTNLTGGSVTYYNIPGVGNAPAIGKYASFSFTTTSNSPLMRPMDYYVAPLSGSSQNNLNFSASLRVVDPNTGNEIQLGSNQAITLSNKDITDFNYTMEPNRTYEFRLYVWNTNGYANVYLDNPNFYVAPIPNIDSPSNLCLSNVSGTVSSALAPYVKSSTPSGMELRWINTLGTNASGTLISADTYKPYYYNTNSGCYYPAGSSITVIANPAGTISPSTQTVCQNSAVTALNASVSGATSYQWYSSNSATGAGTPLSGEVSYNYTPSSSNTGTLYYYLIAQTGSGCPTVSPRASLTVTANPVFNTNPIANSQTYCLNGTATSTSVTSTGNSIQWYANTTNSTVGGTAIGSLATGTSSFTPPTNTAGTTYYYAIATNAAGCTVASNIRTVTVLPELAITQQPDSTTQTVCQNGSSTTLSVTATGATSYQWYYSTAASGGTLTTIAGATSSTYTPPANTLGTRYYYVTASNGTCSVTSSPRIQIMVVANPTAPTYSSPSAASQTVCQNSTPQTLTSNAATSYQWYSNNSNSTSGGTPISGATNQSYVPSTANAGTMYYYVVAGNAAGCTSAAASTKAVITTSVAPGVIAADQTVVFGGDPAAFMVTIAASGAGTLSYQWQKSADAGNNWTDISGAVAPTYDPPAGITQTTLYRRAATSTLSGVGCTAYSNVVTVKLSCNIGVDSDGDGISDICDTDDDNDGISDVNEMMCLKINAIQPTTTGSVNTFEGTGIPKFTATYKVSTVQSATYTYTTNIFGYTNVTAVAAQTNTGSPVITASFNRPVYNLDAALDDIDLSETATLRFYDESNNLIPGSVVKQYVTFIGNQISTVTYPAGQSIYVTGSTAASSTTDSAVRITFPGSIGISRIEYEQFTQQGGGSNNGLVLMNGCIDIDTDGDGIWNRLDLDSDNDGCLDAIEGDENVTPTMLVNSAIGLSVGAGSTASNQNLCADSSCVDIQGVPLVVNNGGVADIGGDQGQGVGFSQNALMNECDSNSGNCTKPGTAGSPLPSKLGILTKASKADGWPENVPNGHIVLDSAEKGFVITHMTTAQRDALTALEGMMIYNTTLNCVQLYRGTSPSEDTGRTGWNCLQPACTTSIVSRNVNIGYWGSLGYNFFSNHPAFRSQLENTANYGTAGTFKGITGWNWINANTDINAAAATFSASQLKAKYDMIVTGWQEMSAASAAKIKQYTDLGGVVFVLMDSGEGPNLNVAFGGTSAMGIGVNAVPGQKARSLNNQINNGLFGTGGGATLYGMNESSRPPVSAIPSDSFITSYLNTSGSTISTIDDNGTEFAGVYITGTKGRAIFVYDEGIFRHTSVAGTAIDTPQEIFLHNLMSYALKKIGFSDH